MIFTGIRGRKSATILIDFQAARNMNLKTAAASSKDEVAVLRFRKGRQRSAARFGSELFDSSFICVFGSPAIYICGDEKRAELSR